LCDPPLLPGSLPHFTPRRGCFFRRGGVLSPSRYLTSCSKKTFQTVFPYERVLFLSFYAGPPEICSYLWKKNPFFPAPLPTISRTPFLPWFGFPGLDFSFFFKRPLFTNGHHRKFSFAFFSFSLSYWDLPVFLFGSFFFLFPSPAKGTPLSHLPRCFS